MKNFLNTPLYQGIIGLSVVFTIDLFIPLGVAVGVLYVCCIALLTRETKKRIFFFSIVVTILILFTLFFFSNTEVSWMVYANRGISLISVWIVSFISIKNKSLSNKVKEHSHELERKNRELEQFAYIASHDLQEPLRTITSFVSFLKEDYSDNLDENGNKYLLFIQKATKRMNVLIKSLLDYSRIRENKPREIVNCNAIVRDVENDLYVQINKSKANIIIGKLPQLKGHKTELRLLFQNLIMNAIKFCDKNTPPKIKIFAKKENDYYKFSVKDNGIGIHAEHKEKIFLMFQRLHDREAYEGAGIGLAHCQKIVAMHGGEITVDSEPNKGSTFYFTIQITPKE